MSTEFQHMVRFFSEAYDNALDTRRHAEFTIHMSGCAACTRAFHEYRRSIDLVRAMPAARMPVDVRLPATPPVAARRAWSPRFAISVPRFLQPQVAGAIGVAAVILVAGFAEFAARRPANGVSISARAPGSHGILAPMAPGSSSVPMGGATTPTGCTNAGVPTGETPAEFSHLTIATAPGRPGEQLVVATDGDQYAAGRQVLVYARLRSPAAAAPSPAVGGPSARDAGPYAVALRPCVTLVAPARHPVAVPASPGATDAVAGGTADESVTITRASPTLEAGQMPLDTITIPSDTPPGSTVTIIADIDANVPLRGEPPMRATLTIRVTG